MYFRAIIIILSGQTALENVALGKVAYQSTDKSSLKLAGKSCPSTTQKATIHQIITSENVLFPGYNHMLATGADDPSL